MTGRGTTYLAARYVYMFDQELSCLAAANTVGFTQHYNSFTLDAIESRKDEHP